MSQLTLGDAEYAGKGKTTRRERFLAEMDQVVPWKSLLGLIEPFSPEAGNGRQPYRLDTMLRLHLVQNWFGLSDPGMEEALYEVASSIGRINALSSSPKARVRVGRARSLGDSGEELGRSPRLTLAEQVPSRCCGHGSSNWAAAVSAPNGAHRVQHRHRDLLGLRRGDAHHRPHRGCGVAGIDAPEKGQPSTSMPKRPQRRRPDPRRAEARPRQA